MSCAKLKRREGESSRCGDQVFGSRVTTSTLAGEYVTARDYVGGRASGGNFETRTSCTRRGIMEKLWRMMYVLSKRGRLTREFGVIMARQNFGSPCSPSCFCLCQGKGGGRHERGAAKRG